jgi:hypothetical protein
MKPIKKKAKKREESYISSLYNILYNNMLSDIRIADSYISLYKKKSLI